MLLSTLQRIPALSPWLTELRRARYYARQFKEGVRDPHLRVRSFRSVRHGVTYYRAWRETILRAERGGSLLEDGIPWINFPAAEFLRRVVSADGKVFEYGSGGSTVWLGRRAAEVVTVEHDRDWCETVRSRLEADDRRNCRLFHVVPGKADAETDPGDPAAYGSQFVGLRDRDFRKYIETIDTFPDDHFDLVCVDGRSRPSAVLHARRKVRSGGWLMLDNSERPWYRRGIELLASWERVTFYGPIPYSHNISETSFWRKP